MNECFGKYYVLNGSLRSAATFDDSLIYEGESVYEVLKSINGLPVFFSDHVIRLQTSVDLTGRTMLYNRDSLLIDILSLTRAERHDMINIKIVFNYRNGINNSLVYYLEPHYPTEDQYHNGVKGILFRAERKDPESKVIDMQLRTEINKKLVLEEGYETLLVNMDNYITEGSRTNVFFIGENKVLTAPDKLILSGITRKHILEICRENHIEVRYECVKADETAQYESAFITGTTPVVLPFSTINEVKFNVDHPFISMLRELYLAKAEESIKIFSIFDSIH